MTNMTYRIINKCSDIVSGLTAVVNVKVPEPEFEGQTKTRLGNPEVINCWFYFILMFLCLPLSTYFNFRYLIHSNIMFRLFCCTSIIWPWYFLSSFIITVFFYLHHYFPWVSFLASCPTFIVGSTDSWQRGVRLAHHPLRMEPIGKTQQRQRRKYH